MLQIKGLTIKTKEKEIIKDFDLEIKEGEIHALMGPNGVGKSTICKVLLNDPNYQVTRGTIVYQNQDIKALTTTQRAQAGMMMICQNPIAIEGVTNAEMLRLALSCRTGAPVDIFSFQKEAREICKKLSLPEDFLHRDINSGASGGERKKIELLHLWMLKPSFLLLDEIDSGLDVDALKLVATSLKEYHLLTNCSILVITHNPKLLEILKPDYVHILKNKKIMQTGDASLASRVEKEGFTLLDLDK